MYQYIKELAPTNEIRQKQKDVDKYNGESKKERHMLGSVFILFGGIPLGIIGIKKAKRMKKLQIATIAFSITNLTAGIIEIIILILLFCSVILGGISA